MNKLVSSLAGASLILVGLLALVGNFVLSYIFPGLHWWDTFRMWPMVVLGIGLALGLMALAAIQRRGLGTLFIPALPIFTTGAILLVASLFNQWHVWALLWPAEVLAVAVGFLLAAIFSRNAWLGIPAILIGLNGLVLAFCNTTGWWSAWSALWTIEPLSVGFILLLVAAKTRSLVVTIVGLCFCGFAFLAFTGMTALFGFNGLLFRAAGPAMLILLGAVLLLANFARGSSVTPPAIDNTSVNNG